MDVERDLLLAWVAGIVDGEGCLTLTSNGSISGFSPRLRISMTDQEAVERVARIIGQGSVVRTKPQTPKHKPQYVWELTCQKAVIAIKMFKPYLFIKDQQADILIRYDEEVRCEFGQRPTLDQIHLGKFLAEEIRKLNKRGPS